MDLHQRPSETLQDLQSESTASGLFLIFMNFMNRQKIEFCVVGDTRDFPEKIDSDVDIIVSSAQLDALPDWVGKLENASPLRLVQILQHEQTAFFLVFALLREGKLTPCYLHPDICSDYYRNGRRLISAEAMLKNARFLSEKQFSVPTIEQNFIYYLIKRIDKNALGNQQQAYLEAQYREAPEACQTGIRRFWKEPERQILLNAIQSGSWRSVLENLPSFRRAIKQACPQTLRAGTAELLRKIRRWMHPTGLWVVFLGADGSGKSSVLEQVQEQLAPAFRRTAYYHLRPNLLRGGTKKTTSVTDPYKQKERSPLISLLKLALFWLDYRLGYLIKLRPALVRSTLICFDRHLVDIAIDPKRYRYAGPVWLTKMLCRLTPRPDCFILLDAPTEVLQARKQEVSWEDTEKQRQAYLYWARLSPDCCHIVDASEPLAHVIAEVNHLLLSSLAEKTRNRFYSHGG